MPEMFHPALHVTVWSGHCCNWDWALGSNSGHLLRSFYPAIGTSCSEFKLLISMQLHQRFGQMLLHLLFVPILNVPLFW